MGLSVDLARIAVLAVATSVGCRSRTVGGACSYEKFETSCELTTLAEKPSPDGRTITMNPEYQIGGRPPGYPVQLELTVAAEDAAAMRTHLRTHPVVSCSGERIVSGSCYPHYAKLQLPRAPVACEERSTHDKADGLCAKR